MLKNTESFAIQRKVKRKYDLLSNWERKYMLSMRAEAWEVLFLHINTKMVFLAFQKKTLRRHPQTKVSLIWMSIVIYWVSYTKIIYFSQFWRLKSLISRCWHIWYLVRAASWFIDSSFLAISSLVRRSKRVLWSLL